MNKSFLKIAGVVSGVVLSGSLIYILLSFEKSFWTSSRSITMILDDQVKSTFTTIDKQAINPYSIELRMSGKINGQGVLKFGWSDSSFYGSDTKVVTLIFSLRVLIGTTTHVFFDLNL